jgi:hypothetical protein
MPLHTKPVKAISAAFWSMNTVRKYRNDTLLLFSFVFILAGTTWAELKWKMYLKGHSSDVFWAQLQTSIIWRCFFSYLSVWAAVLPKTLWHWPTDLLNELRKDAAPKEDVWNKKYLEIVMLVAAASFYWGFAWFIYTLIVYDDSIRANGTRSRWDSAMYAAIM